MNNIPSQVFQKVFLIISEIWTKKKSKQLLKHPVYIKNKILSKHNK